MEDSVVVKPNLIDEVEQSLEEEDEQKQEQEAEPGISNKAQEQKSQKEADDEQDEDHSTAAAAVKLINQFITGLPAFVPDDPSPEPAEASLLISIIHD